MLPSIFVPLGTTLGGICSDIWDSLLRAVPKKKTSHQKSRSRRMAGKALKDITHLNRCSACGRVKRMHILCPYCVQSMSFLHAGKLAWATSSAWTD